MIKKVFFSVLLIFAAVSFCLAIDITGKWSGTMETPDGTAFPLSYNLKVEGDKLTGFVEIPDAELEIVNGKIENGKFSFMVNYQGRSYLNEGKLEGDSLKIKVHFGADVIQSVLKRESKTP